MLCDIFVIRNPIVGSTENSLTKKLTISESNSIKLVFMGRVTEEKGILKFIDKLQVSKFNIDFHIYGTGELVDAIKSLDLRVGLKIIFHGYIERDKLLEEVSSYDIFVLPSIWYENAPLSILEAANLGLPVIVPNYGGLKEMASLTNKYFMFDYSNSSIDDCLYYAMEEVNNNFIANPKEFTYDNYKKNIINVYFK
ncbi:glycosyltransferase family 4 protein [Klebsiella sp. B345]|uniref:glycosyltransferase family 4 protein n=1 Tax=Klebsiella sp. B345 TaxID=2755398 RepID=UPI003DA7E06A